MATVLLIEDDLTFSRILEGFLVKNNYQVLVAHNAKDGLKVFEQRIFDVVLLDYRLPDTTGMEVLVQMKKLSPNIPVIIMTGFSDIRTAVKAIKLGALEYITKPVNPDELIMLVKEATRAEKPSLKRKISKDSFVQGHSYLSSKLHDYIRLVAPTGMSVIIQGESGTGKEYVARTIHKLSARSNAPFVAVDCGALSKDLAASELFGHVKGSFTGAMNDKTGQFEAAHGGTLFLDEVGNLSYEVQVKLLRAIQERVVSPIGSNKEVRVDVRIITATNDDLAVAVKNGQFREDLFHRLNEFMLEVPPLRERLDDLDEFLDFFRESANQELSKNVVGFDERVMRIFNGYDWPGNLRELKNVVKRAVLLTSEEKVSVDALPIEMVNAQPRPALHKQVVQSPPVYDLKALQETQEKEMIVKTLLEVRYNKSKAARILNIDRKTLYLKMEKYGIE